jgi:hypothetical protein
MTVTSPFMTHTILYINIQYEVFQDDKKNPNKPLHQKNTIHSNIHSNDNSPNHHNNKPQHKHRPSGLHNWHRDRNILGSKLQKHHHCPGMGSNSCRLKQQLNDLRQKRMQLSSVLIVDNLKLCPNIRFKLYDPKLELLRSNPKTKPSNTTTANTSHFASSR